MCPLTTKTQVLSLTPQPTRRTCSSPCPSLEFFDAKFFPYLEASEDPVFAAVSKKHVSRQIDAHSFPPV